MPRYSFDVFDTLLTRTLPSPPDVFRCVQRRLNSAPADIPGKVRQQFVALRIWLEYKARRLSPREDVTLAEIYSLLAEQFALAPTAAELLLEMELAVECLCSAPVGHNCAKVQRLRRLSPAMIYVSDMYLPSEFIRGLLEHHGLWRDGDSLYVSGSIGLTKGRGSLYRYLLDRERLAAAELVHCGDNLHSDVVVPRQLGVVIDPEFDAGSYRSPDFWPGFLAKARYALLLLRARSALRW